MLRVQVGLALAELWLEQGERERVQEFLAHVDLLLQNHEVRPAAWVSRGVQDALLLLAPKHSCATARAGHHGGRGWLF